MSDTIDGYQWVEASDESNVDFVVRMHSLVKDEVARIGPGLRGRWWVLLGPRGKPTPPHDHNLGFTYRANPDHPARCTSPACWSRTVLDCDGNIVRLTDEEVVS